MHTLYTILYKYGNFGLKYHDHDVIPVSEGCPFKSVWFICKHLDMEWSRLKPHLSYAINACGNMQQNPDRLNQLPANTKEYQATPKNMGGGTQVYVHLAMVTWYTINDNSLLWA